MQLKAIIAMSGGVDSSVAAYLVKQQGYDAVGVTLKLFDNEDVNIAKDKTCCSLNDIDDARSVANALGIPYYVFNFRDFFKDQVISRFVESYVSGSTPNPCIDCNRYIKFSQLLLRAKQLDFDYLVTGHYARIEYDKPGGRYLLKKAVDETKDQSYVLYFLTQEQLAHTLFPLGSLNKSETREIAKENYLINAHKHDSQDICFVVNGDYASFIENYTNERFEAGKFIGINGEELGEHKGIIRYTIGQRKGLGLSLPKPLYVCSKNAQDNSVTLGEEKDLYSKSLLADNINLIACDTLQKPIRVKAKTRYRQTAQWATVTQTSDDNLMVEFDEPQRAVTKGQAVVFYDDDIVVGGGTIL